MEIIIWRDKLIVILIRAKEMNTKKNILKIYSDLWLLSARQLYITMHKISFNST